jgi:hypothetical protein
MDMNIPARPISISGGQKKKKVWATKEPSLRMGNVEEWESSTADHTFLLL